MAELAFEPMSIGQILDRTFSIYRRNFVRFITIVAVISVPVSFVHWGGAYLLNHMAAGGGQGAPALGIAKLAGTLFGVLIVLLGTSLCNAALLHGVSESYMGNSVSVGEAYRRVLPKFLTLILAAFLVGLVTTVGLVLLIVPGIIFALRLTLTIPAIVVEDLGATGGMGRSWRLAAGNMGKVFGLLLCLWLIGMIVGLVFQGAGVALGRQLAPQGYFFVTQFSGLLGNVLVMPISATATILLYYDLRIRKEGFDLEMLAERLAAEGGGSHVGESPR